jgi:hypothetical protein
VVYYLRFINNCVKGNDNRKGILFANEIQKTNHCIIKMVQKQAFESKLNALRVKDIIDKESSLLSLTPFLNKDNIL